MIFFRGLGIIKRKLKFLVKYSVVSYLVQMSMLMHWGVASAMPFVCPLVVRNGNKVEKKTSNTYPHLRDLTYTTNYTFLIIKLAIMSSGQH